MAQPHNISPSGTSQTTNGHTHKEKHLPPASPHFAPQGGRPHPGSVDNLKYCTTKLSAINSTVQFQSVIESRGPNAIHNYTAMA